MENFNIHNESIIKYDEHTYSENRISNNVSPNQISNLSKKPINRPEDYSIIGTHEFSKAVNNILYVDKTKLIEDIIKSNKRAYIITRPRRSGKSMNIDMIIKFFSPEGDNKYMYKNGKYDFSKMNKNAELFSDLYIKQNEYFFNEYQGKHPVIYLSLTGYNLASNINKFMRTSVSNLYKNYIYLLDYMRNEHQKNIFKKHLTKTSDDSELQESLSFLAELLNDHFNKGVVFLVDEYDYPYKESDILKGLENEKHKTSLKNIYVWLSNLTKTNIQYLLFSAFFGIIPLNYTDAFSGLNNITTFSMNHDEFFLYFGLTKEEINNKLDVLVKKGYTINDYEAINSKITEWYNGYKVKNKQNETLSIFNIYSVIKYLEECCNSNNFSNHEPKSHWVNTGDILGLFSSIDFNNIFNNDNNFLKLFFNQEPIIIDQIEQVDVSDRESILFFLLFHCGYLTNDENEMNYTIPNNEVRLEIKRIFVNKFKLIIKKDNDKKDIVDKLIDGNYKEFFLDLKSFLLKSLLRIQFKYENSFQMFLYGFLLCNANKNCEVNIDSEVNSGLGRPDIIITTKHKCFIMEIKTVNKNENSLIKLDEGIDQILEKKYYSKFLGLKIILISLVLIKEDLNIAIRIIDDDLTYDSTIVSLL